MTIATSVNVMRESIKALFMASSGAAMEQTQRNAVKDTETKGRQKRAHCRKVPFIRITHRTKADTEPLADDVISII